MVGAHDLIHNERALDICNEPLGNNEIIDPPADILLAGEKSVRPPGIRGPGRTWNDVPWIAFELYLTRDELVSLSPEYGNQVILDSTLAGAGDRKDGDNPREVFKHAKVCEIWDKNRREVLIIAESFKEKPIRKENDPLGLMGFFPIPRPLYAVKTSDSLVPITPYSLYQDQAEELERVTCRIMALTEGVKSRGIYDGQLTEIIDLAGADDNTLVPVQNVMP